MSLKHCLEDCNPALLPLWPAGQSASSPNAPRYAEAVRKISTHYGWEAPEGNIVTATRELEARIRSHHGGQ